MRNRCLNRVAMMACAALAAGSGGCVAKRIADPGPPTILFPSDPPRDSAVRVVTRPGLPRDAAPGVPVDGDQDVRVALATAAQQAPLTATGAWRLYNGTDGVLIRGRANETWTVEHGGTRIRAVGRGGAATPWVDGAVMLRPDDPGALSLFAGRRYRGAIRVVPNDSGLVIVNVLDIEEYLRGVVPLEIGPSRAPNEQSAVEVQAIAARSYAWVRLFAVRESERATSYDLVATVNDQVYGGVDAEREGTDRAVRATAGLVVKFGGRVVDTPYSSSCGGQTAAPDEVWRVGPSAYLRRVSDRIPGSADRYYCDISPRFAWTTTFSGADLDAAIRAYLGAYADVPASGPGGLRAFSIESRTPSGRVASAAFLTDRGAYALRGNEVRYVLRRAGGEILNSTYFSVSSELGQGGSLARLVIRGNGYGHGVGMCQWGAIGRARAGQTARTILAAYFPGTTVGLATVNR